MKFNKKLTFEEANRLRCQEEELVTASNVAGGHIEREATTNYQTASATLELHNHNNRDIHHIDHNSHNERDHSWRKEPPLDISGASIYGQPGSFCRIANDFAPQLNYGSEYCVALGEAGDESTTAMDGGQQENFQDEAHWSSEKRHKVKCFRFVVCSLALVGMALGLMSRLMLNVSIVEMVKSKAELVAADESIGLIDDVPLEEALASTFHTPTPLNLSLPMLSNNNTSSGSIGTTTTTNSTGIFQNLTQIESEQLQNSTNSQPQLADILEFDDGLHFNWTKRDVNIVLASFYFGYAPGILFSGSLAERYGAKWPMFVCIFGSAIINVLTPTIARLSLALLVASRVFLGLIQGSLMPCLYELFNKWLTKTESSIFAPMIKVGMPLGSLVGTLMPGLVNSFGIEWPFLFYMGGALCFVWATIWLLLATSTPQTNSFVEQDELARIMRKKIVRPLVRLSLVSLRGTSSSNNTTTTINNNDTTQSQSSRQVVGSVEKERQRKESPRNEVAKSRRQSATAAAAARGSTPWLAIITNPSVLALTLVKFTYNIGMDFIALELALFLREMHEASIETISLIASAGYCMQMIFITFVGWLAKTLVAKRSFDFSVTKWRKVFQGGSNLAMGATYLFVVLSSAQLELITVLMLMVCFFWMFGAGGESLVPYDLSSKYPASIMGLAHSISILSGVALPLLCDAILGEETDDPDRWNLLFLILAGSQAFGGIVFVLVLRAKPFLPEERAAAAAATALAASQAVAKNKAAAATEKSGHLPLSTKPRSKH